MHHVVVVAAFHVVEAVTAVHGVNAIAAEEEGPGVDPNQRHGPACRLFKIRPQVSTQAIQTESLSLAQSIGP